MALRAYFDDMRSIAYTSISGSYAAIGSAFTVAARIICITNLTDKAMIVSDDSSVAAGKLIIPAGGNKLFDITSNMNPNKDGGFEFPIGMTLYVKQVSAPGSGSVYVEAIYG